MNWYIQCCKAQRFGTGFFDLVESGSEKMCRSRTDNTKQTQKCHFNHVNKFRLQKIWTKNVMIKKIQQINLHSLSWAL